MQMNASKQNTVCLSTYAKTPKTGKEY